MLKAKLPFLILVITLALFALTGCSITESTNIESFYYVIAIGIDTSKENNMVLNIQVATSDSSSSSDSAQSSTSEIYSVPCSTINTGISILDNYLSKKLDFSHCSAVLFSEEFAKNGIEQHVNTLVNNPEIRPTCDIIISNTDAKTALECISNSNEAFSAKLYEFILNSVDYTGYSINPDINTFCYNLKAKTSTNIATYANIQDDIIQNTGIAIFDGDKFLDNLTVLDSISYSLITNKLNTCTISINNPFNESELMNVSLTSPKNTSIEVKIENNYPYITIKGDLNYSIDSASTNLNYEDFNTIKTIENCINSYLEKILLNFLYKISHEYNQDICDFKNNVSSQFLTYDELDKINWKEIYKDSYFNVQINGNIVDTGLFSKE